MTDVGPGFPLKENCDPTNPEEAFLWMLVALPAQNGAPLIMPVGYLRCMSQRLWDCGARPTAEPVIKYRRPTGMEPHWMTSPGRWVDVNDPDPEPKTAEEAIAMLAPQQRAEILKLLRAKEAGE